VGADSVGISDSAEPEILDPFPTHATHQEGTTLSRIWAFIGHPTPDEQPSQNTHLVDEYHIISMVFIYFHLPVILVDGNVDEKFGYGGPFVTTLRFRLREDSIAGRVGGVKIGDGLISLKATTGTEDCTSGI